MDALARAKCFQTEAKELLEVEAPYGESTFPEAHAFLLRKFVFRTRAEILGKRYRTGEELAVENENIGNLRTGGRLPQTSNDDGGGGKGRAR